MEMIALLLISGMAGHAVPAENADTWARVSGSGTRLVRQIEYSPRLRANASNTRRYIARGICERQGLLEISEILKRSDFEEMWAFLPRANDAQDCEWHEIGHDEKSERESANVRVDMDYLEQLMAANTEIHLYHFHPLRYFECAARATCPQVAVPGQAKSVDLRWITDLVFSMPSPSDVHFMMDVTSRFYTRHQGRGTIKHKVVTPYGLVDYRLTDKGLVKFDSEKHERSGGLYITWVAANALADDYVERVIKNHPGSLIAGVRRLARTLNTEFLRVEHTHLPGQKKRREPHVNSPKPTAPAKSTDTKDTKEKQE